ncbi:imm11 family protein [Pseudalkalibacillus sp. Hm43]|uniref:imm11 family protein n=1 Tax=Pseudalkalibacillus sp. Hm43 TaxID=3450742 RepID=UPI003F439952
MKVWMLTVEFGDYEVLSFSNEEASDIFRDNFRGEPMKQNWTPIQVERYKDGVESDFPDGLSIHPVFSEKAVRVLNELLNENVELLPLLTESGEREYYAINVINVLDCIDERHSEVERFRNGKIMEYTKYAFQKDVIKEENIFKIVDHEKKIIFSTKVFVSDLFRERVLESGLKGFDFIEVWDSEKSEKEDVVAKPVPTMDTSQEIYSFEEATNLVEQQSKVVVSESLEWAMRLGDEKQTQIGHLQEDGDYKWMNPIYYPPIFLEMKWRTVNTSNKL